MFVSVSINQLFNSRVCFNVEETKSLKEKTKKKKKTSMLPIAYFSFKSNPCGNKNHSEGHKSEIQPQLKNASKSAVFLYGRFSLFLKDPFFQII